MELNNQPKGKAAHLFALVVIPVIILVCFVLYFKVLGAPSNFQNNDINNHPKEGNYLGIVYKGGLIVPFLMSFLLMVITFSVERAFTIAKAFGKGSISGFVGRVKSLLRKDDIAGAIDECDKQKGSVGNVVYTALHKYGQLTKEKGLSKEQKIVALQKEVEEATALELPMLEKNLTIIATLASISTLVGLLGTVIGMIKAFAALATAGVPDATGLANGISEALINTALGISASAFAIISYNFFTSKIDELTYNIDEIGFSITQNFSANYQEDKKLETTSVN